MKAIPRIDDGAGNDLRGEAIENASTTWENRYLIMSN
jgi:hypothetical protein